MNEYVADTMAIVLRLEKRRMSDAVKDIFKKAESESNKIYIPTIVVAEIGYLSEKGRIETNITALERYCAVYSSVQIIHLDFTIVKNAFTIKDIPELHDRLIAASAFTYKLHLVTNDPVIRASKTIQTFW